MADYPTEQDRLRAVEEILLTLLGGPNSADFQDFDRLYYLQELSQLLRKRKISSRGQVEFRSTDHNDGKWFSLQAALRSEIDRLTRDNFETLQILSNSTAFADQRFHRAMSLSFYIASHDPSSIEEADTSLREVAAEVDLQVVYERPPEFGSWFKEVYAKTRTALTSKEAQDALQKVQRGLEIKHLYREQAKADLDLSKAAKNISSILEKQKNAVVVLGSISGIKTTINGHASLAIVALTQEELIAIQNNPELRRGPKELLELLQNMRGQDFQERNGYLDVPLEHRKIKKTNDKKPIPPFRPALPKD